MTESLPFSPKLDVISENIIYLLSIDSRQTVSDLAKTLTLNRKIVENRVKKIFHNGYVKHLTISNEKKRIRFTMLIKLKEIDNQMSEKLKQLPSLIKLKQTFGIYDLSALFDVYSTDEMEKTVAHVSNMLHNKLQTYDVILHDFEDTMGYKSFCHNSAFLSYYRMLKPAPIALSEEEEIVLELMKGETTISMKELVAQSNMSFSTVKGIMEHLKENQIVRHSLDPDYTKLQLEFHNMFIKIKVGKREQFEKYLIAYPRIHWIKKCTSGKWDYILSIAARSLNELAEITKEIRSQNKNIILDETTLVSQIWETRRR